MIFNKVATAALKKTIILMLAAIKGVDKGNG